MPILIVFDDVKELSEFYADLEVCPSSDCPLEGRCDSQTSETTETDKSAQATETPSVNNTEEPPKVATKKTRGRPKKSEIDTSVAPSVESAVVTTEVVSGPKLAETPVPTVADVREACVKASDVVGPGKIVELLNKYTGGVSSKAADVPEDLRDKLIGEIEKMLEGAA